MRDSQPLNTPVMKGTVDVLFFSQLRELVGTASLSMDVIEATTAGALLEKLALSYPAIADFLSCIRIAVNQEYVDGHHVVRPGDEVALITPVSGG